MMEYVREGKKKAENSRSVRVRRYKEKITGSRVIDKK